MVIPCVSVYGWALMSPEMVLYVNSYIMQFYQNVYDSPTQRYLKDYKNHEYRAKNFTQD